MTGGLTYAPYAIISPRLDTGYACKYCVILLSLLTCRRRRRRFLHRRRRRLPKGLLKIHTSAGPGPFEYRRYLYDMPFRRQRRRGAVCVHCKSIF